MKEQITFLFVLVVFLNNGSMAQKNTASTLVKNTGCTPKQVKLLTFMDGTNNVDKVREQMEELAVDVISNLPTASTTVINSVATEVSEITVVNKPLSDLTWVDKLRDKANIRQDGDTVSASALDNEASQQFSVNLYKTVAEIALILVTDATKLDTIPPFLAKKKTFLIIFGSDIPSIWASLASREDHLFFVHDRDDLETVTANLVQQIACDSRYVCDTDMYMLPRSSKCKNCSNVCAEDITELTGACGLRCPYLHIKPGKLSDVTDAQTTHSGANFAVQDHKQTITMAVAISLGILVLVVVFGIFGYCFYQRRKSLTPANSDQTLPKTFQLPDSVAVVATDQDNAENAPLMDRSDGPDTVHEESEVSDSDDESLNVTDDNDTNPNIPPPDEEVADSDQVSVDLSQSDVDLEESISSDRDSTASITITFKNPQEFDANAHFSSTNDNFVCLH